MDIKIFIVILCVLYKNELIDIIHSVLDTIKRLLIRDIDNCRRFNTHNERSLSNDERIHYQLYTINDMYVLNDNRQPNIPNVNPKIFYSYNHYLQYVDYQNQNGGYIPIFADPNTYQMTSRVTNIQSQPYGEKDRDREQEREREREREKEQEKERISVTEKQPSVIMAPTGMMNNSHILSMPKCDKDDNNNNVIYIQSSLSDNAMDSNWGGVNYSRKNIYNGLYI